ncbi:hypothetical protein ColLi_12835 [Colletotrichum liriopes]|uniref:Uncharacterized protein n=1 Tax=Colletotrichum liriopes TaxID=708192 RepID=A0AA37LZ06_9PEZI|nr:hypothetical protein ColLi_12835 [Colletotrichum liriopes]
MSNRKDHGLKQHGLSDDAVEAGHDFIHDAEVEEERAQREQKADELFLVKRHSGDLNTMPSMGSQQKKGVNLEGMQPSNPTGQEKAGKKA